MSRTVAEALVDVLEEVGIKQVFGLIGDSLNPLGDAVRQSKIEWVGVRHEEGAALAAAGQAKLTGRLAVCAGTTGPGSTHLVAGLYEAARDHAPVLALSGEMPRRLKGIDYHQSTEPDLLFRDVSLYTQTITAPAQAPSVIHQAISSAYAGPGVAHLTLPQDVLSSKVEHAVSSVATLGPRAEIAPAERGIDAVARRIDAAGSVAILCGAGCRGSADLLRDLSDRLKAPLVHTVRSKEIIAYDDPRWMGGLGMIGSKPAYAAVQDCELLLMVGTDYPYSNFLPAHGNIIQIDERAAAIGRRAPTALGVVGSVRPTLSTLLRRVRQKTGSAFFDKVARGRRAWDELLDKQSDLMRSRDRIHPQAVARMVSDLAKDDAVFVFDTGLNTLWSGNWIRQSGKQRIVGSFNNAAVGTALGQANGIQALDRSRQVIVLTGDGGFNMLMSEFLTAVHHHLPVKIVVFDNAAFGLITLEAQSVGILPFRKAIEFTNPDYAALGRACGAQGFTVRDPALLEATLIEAFACPGPAIVACGVATDEMPNLPHIELEQVGGYAVAKIKEAIAAFTGG
ncbi:ubiquinone-dependent pyruvate dehydrogenase [Mesorhizobium sp. BR1-1-7]|uniref:thiamine pyrophosphate-binding protein n=1 Tax=Mesorhizobium sp. BR1-1-7 TaxID=2876647 RepID=UPI001CCDB5B7|nr:thiamine pyrophosphate-binding protein [Mesorhizobium sp. BR1-1-7]MBZ9921350.1 ubiquinone-dependent pyruvate dehydrogenase [Mesorhizobium sp. BR1-1-7]